MNKLLTAICCLSLALVGYFTTSVSTPSVLFPKENSLHAATIPYKDIADKLPIDLKLNMGKKVKPDTVKVEIHDTVKVDNVKYVRVPGPKRATDTIYVPLDMLGEIEVTPVKNRSPGSNEGLDNDSISKSIIVLSIDGKIVYSSKADGQSAFDEP